MNGTPFDGKTVVASDTSSSSPTTVTPTSTAWSNFDDYSRTDSGFNNHRTGWFNGDFDYNGVVNFDDYSLIDQAFNTQGTVVLAEPAIAGRAGLERSFVRIRTSAR